MSQYTDAARIDAYTLPVPSTAGETGGLETARLIGRYGAPPGPRLICIGGLHGNEPSGVLALRRVLSSLRSMAASFSGELIAVAGNLQALRAGRRYLAEDLNRGWSSRLRWTRDPGIGTEEIRERMALRDLIDSSLTDDTAETRVLDLHTTSGISIPFVTLGDTLRNRAFARHMGLPLVLGIEEQIDGALLEVITDRGAVGIGVEAGQHVDPTSVDHHERVVWMALVAGGHVRADDVPNFRAMKDDLRNAWRGLPAVFEVRYRRPVLPGDGFRMLPGFANFQPVRRGETVARDRGGDICSPEDGRIFLPLYQDQGDDGFFIVREVRPFWLRVSAALRRARIDALVPALPGVHRTRRRPDTLIVNQRVARWLTPEVFHLFGYRRSRVSRGLCVFRRRTERPSSGP